PSPRYSRPSARLVADETLALSPHLMDLFKPFRLRNRSAGAAPLPAWVEPLEPRQHLSAAPLGISTQGAADDGRTPTLLRIHEFARPPRPHPPVFGATLTDSSGAPFASLPPVEIPGEIQHSHAQVDVAVSFGANATGLFFPPVGGADPDHPPPTGTLTFFVD